MIVARTLPSAARSCIQRCRQSRGGDLNLCRLTCLGLPFVPQPKTPAVAGEEFLDPFLVETERLVGIRVATITVDFVLRVIEPSAKATFMLLAHGQAATLIDFLHGGERIG
jgi:hypothetical protein